MFVRDRFTLIESVRSLNRKFQEYFRCFYSILLECPSRWDHSILLNVCPLVIGLTGMCVCVWIPSGISLTINYHFY